MRTRCLSVRETADARTFYTTPIVLLRFGARIASPGRFCNATVSRGGPGYVMLDRLTMRKGALCRASPRTARSAPARCLTGYARRYARCCDAGTTCPAHVIARTGNRRPGRHAEKRRHPAMWNSTCLDGPQRRTAAILTVLIL